ncbi:MAG: site-specific integrase [Bacteroidota bacterium]
MPSYNVELNNKPIKGSNEHTLLLRITVDRKHVRIKLDYAVLKNQFNPNPQQAKYIRQSHPKHKTINGYLDDKIQADKDAAKNLIDEGKQVTSFGIKQKMINPGSKSFSEFTKVRIVEMDENNEVANAMRYQVLLNKVDKYRNGSDLLFSEIDHSFLRGFQAYLKKLGNSENTIHANFRIIRAIVYKAIELGIVKQAHNPFFSFKLKEGEVNRTRLTIEEIKKIEELNLSKVKLIWHVRNAFLFSFYNAGIRASDLLRLKWINIIDGRLVFQMQKTKHGHSVKLKEKPLSILSMYDRTDPDSFIFPFLSNDVDYSDPHFMHKQISAKTALLNKYLKSIAAKAGIEKKISTHTARHSFADIARQKTNNLYNLSKTLGHSSIKITEAYLASFDEKAVDDTMDEVFN